MIGNIYSTLFYALVLTILIELAICYLIGFKGKDELKIVIYMNIITNTTLNLILVGIGYLANDVTEYYNIVLFLEVAVIFVEFGILFYVFNKMYSISKLFFISLLLNTTSFGIGLLINYLFF